MQRHVSPFDANAANVLVADLIHDTAANVLPDGVRSGVWARARRLLFAIGEVEIMLQLSSRADGGTDVAGQISVSDIPLVGVPISLESDGEDSTAVTERGGGFWLHTVGAAECSLVYTAHGYQVRTVPFSAHAP